MKANLNTFLFNNLNMIKNLTTNKILTQKKEFAISLWQKFRGLMFRKLKNKGLIFIFNKEQVISLHMIFVFHPIDVLWLNSEKEVVEIKRIFKPFTFYTPKSKAKYVIEFPANTIKEIKIKDKIYF